MIKLCECGCGQPAPISPYNDPKRGYVKGEPLRFIKGHYRGAALRTREQHPLWQGDAASAHVARKRAEAWFPLPDLCERCPQKATQRHHRDRNPLNNDPTNIEFLCARCHVREHGPERVKTHCPHGHPYSGENLYVNPKTGLRYCRECIRTANRLRSRRKNAEKREQKALAASNS